MINLFKVHRALRARGVLGINARNRDFIYPYNPRRNYPLVDDKVTTKALAIEAGVRVPEQYAVLEYQGHFHLLRKVAEKHDEFFAERMSQKPIHVDGKMGEVGGQLVVYTDRIRFR